MRTTDIEELLATYADAPVECDGFVRLAHTALVKADIEHRCFCGSLKRAGVVDGLPVHLWIELSDGRMIDYRARMWFGSDPTVPHGIFEPSAFPGWVYCGQEVTVPVASDLVVSVLLMPTPDLSQSGWKLF